MRIGVSGLYQQQLGACTAPGPPGRVRVFVSELPATLGSPNARDMRVQPNAMILFILFNCRRTPVPAPKLHCALRKRSGPSGLCTFAPLQLTSPLGTAARPDCTNGTLRRTPSVREIGRRPQGGLLGWAARRY